VPELRGVLDEPSSKIVRAASPNTPGRPGFPWRVSTCEMVNSYSLGCLRDPIASTLCYTVASFLTAALLAFRIRSEFLDSPAFRR
jgi:hypothetical protein